MGRKEKMINFIYFQKAFIGNDIFADFVKLFM